jgi:hypothetical protein
MEANGGRERNRPEASQALSLLICLFESAPASTAVIVMTRYVTTNLHENDSCVREMP